MACRSTTPLLPLSSDGQPRRGFPCPRKLRSGVRKDRVDSERVPPFLHFCQDRRAAWYNPSGSIRTLYGQPVPRVAQTISRAARCSPVRKSSHGLRPAVARLLFCHFPQTVSRVVDFLVPGSCVQEYSRTEWIQKEYLLSSTSAKIAAPHVVVLPEVFARSVACRSTTPLRPLPPNGQPRRAFPVPWKLRSRTAG
ncbi:hypothetical protein pipiens_012603 [Culex pipiens pipiens]|uniref:Uncharacterized protein n=1 Tax=Culex pipiens pipiens TaxID=38569 RepID=A0ABD1D1M9_CULPP